MGSRQNLCTAAPVRLTSRCDCTSYTCQGAALADIEEDCGATQSMHSMYGCTVRQRSNELLPGHTVLFLACFNAACPSG